MTGECGLLARQLAKIGSTGVGGDAVPVCCGPGDAPAGAARAAAFVSGLLPAPRWHAVLVLPMPPEAAVRRVHRMLSHAGRLLDIDELVGCAWPCFGALLHDGGGFGDRVVAAASVVDVSEDGTHVVIAASAKEGLWSQRTAELAVTRLAARLRAAGHAPLAPR